MTKKHFVLLNSAQNILQGFHDLFSLTYVEKEFSLSHLNGNLLKPRVTKIISKQIRDKQEVVYPSVLIHTSISFLAGVGRNQLYAECSSAQTSHEPVQTCSAKHSRACKIVSGQLSKIAALPDPKF